MKPKVDHQTRGKRQFNRRSQSEDLAELRVHEVMTPYVVTVDRGESVGHAARLMDECDCGALPVVGENGELAGMVTDRDIALRIVGQAQDVAQSCVADCMTDVAFFCSANERVVDCMRLMSLHQVRRIPVVDDSNRVVGIVSQGDLARRAGSRAKADEQCAVADVVCAVSEPTNASHR